MNAYQRLLSSAHRFGSTASNCQLIQISVETALKQRHLTDPVEQRLARKVEKIFLDEINARLEAGWR